MTDAYEQPPTAPLLMALLSDTRSQLDRLEESITTAQARMCEIMEADDNHARRRFVDTSIRSLTMGLCWRIEQMQDLM